ncbi:hypothetical protein CORC01_10829 [Colletotrichum orchidophilum]|uniref:Uncharacterized protein n=1 Tax=Colletotrichum orchidophilum TaxID=1209926 RepID=A0A1G4AXP3_9PEZI|nr:uncharacterized protein CORC01_10829 [Colletotrichum orchidophilum]OHE93930.1 hypothetical protein CORC01_10829 [Colletotrichum orchidophilum]
MSLRKVAHMNIMARAALLTGSEPPGCGTSCRSDASGCTPAAAPEASVNPAWATPSRQLDGAAKDDGLSLWFNSVDTTAEASRSLVFNCSLTGAWGPNFMHTSFRLGVLVAFIAGKSSSYCTVTPGYALNSVIRQFMLGPNGRADQRRTTSGTDRVNLEHRGTRSFAGILHASITTSLILLHLQPRLCERVTSLICVRIPTEDVVVPGRRNQAVFRDSQLEQSYL